ncbi:MAG: sulfatase-like hydrolase/transferase [Planctomycetota bacterium]
MPAELGALFRWCGRRDDLTSRTGGPRGGEDGTIVLVTGDHGEEFYENGYWGHTSNYTPEQVDVPMFVYGPGITPGHESRPTSHVDVSGSLLELLGDDPSRQKGWFQGVSLWAPQESPRARVVAGFADVGVLTPSGIFMFPLETGKDDQLVWDEDWKPKPGMAALLTQEQERLIEFVQQCHEFLEPLP